MAKPTSDTDMIPFAAGDDGNCPQSFSCQKNACDEQGPLAAPDKPGISSYWRKNTSARESVELANLLRAIQKVAGHLGPNAGRIEYEGMSGGWGMSGASGSAIRIPSEWVMGAYPVPPEKVDFVIGYVVHKALHHMEWSTLVWRTLEPEMKGMSPFPLVMFQQMVATGEDIYMDWKSNGSVLGLYTAILRGSELACLDKITPLSGLSLDELLLTWRSSLFHGPVARKEKPEYLPLLDVLNDLARHLRDVAGEKGRVVGKGKKRASLYLDAWQRIGDPIHRLTVHKKQLHWFPARPAKGAGKINGPVDVQTSSKMAPQLVREIETRLAADAVDITPLIRSVAGFDNETVAPMSRWDFTMPSRPVIDKRMIGRLKAIFQNYADRRTLVNRGLTRGRVDPGRLYRAPVNGRCFKETLRIPGLDWCIGLLVDASGSMHGRKWQMVESIIANLHRAVSGDKNRLHAWAYFESGGICMISRLLKEGMLLSIPPAGQTASGQAIIAAAMMMPKKRKRRILVHVTDGQSNFGCDVSYGIERCRQENIHLITLGCGYKSKKAMQAQYSGAIQFIDHFEQLPRAMENLLRSLFLYGGKMNTTISRQRNTVWPPRN
ncbi:MAG: VWA domain-containing protein [Desulfosalsimonadaceae bacterium]